MGSVVTRFGAFEYGLSSAEEDRAALLHATSEIVDLIWWGPMTHQSVTARMDAALKAAYAESGDITAVVSYAQRLPGRLAVSGELPEYRSVWDASGVTAGHWDISVGDTRLLLEGVSHVDYLVDHLPWLRKAIRSEDFRQAKREGGHALYLQCQPTPPISRDLGLIDLAYDAGLRVLQLTYNVQDAIGCGCTERSNSGVSALGAKLIERLNDLGVIVDTAHCNEQTVLDACRISQRPVIVSHTASAALYAHDRGISDKAAEAVAATGGIIGVVAVPSFLGPDEGSVNTMLEHIDHFVGVLGSEHVAIATDWPLAAPKWVLEKRMPMLLANGFRAEHGLRPTQNLAGFDDYRDFPNITRGLVARGYTDEQIRGILGGNFLRIFEAVCG